MNFRNNIQLAAFIAMICVAGHLSARENLVTSHHKAALKTTASGCTPAASAIDLNINNLDARLMTGGDMWWNIGEAIAAYEIPKGSGKCSQFAASCWIGGFDQQGQLKVAAQTYRQDGNDYWPGALDLNGKITADVCNLWDKQWKVDKATINSFVALSKTGGDVSGKAFDVIRQWPGAGNHNAVGNGLAGSATIHLDETPYSNNTYAPFVDINGNGIYEPLQGEYPDILGDEFIWWVFNDAGNVKGQSQTASIGVEVQTSAFAYSTQDFLNNSSFYNYRVINRGALTMDSTYIALWDDCDLGYYYDDFIGCDTTRGLGIQYNGTNDDGGGAGHPVNSYGPNPPQVGVDFFKGPKRPGKTKSGADTLIQLSMTNFTYFNNDASAIGNPDNGIQIYYYMTGSIRTGQRFADDFQGPGIPTKGYGSGPISNFVFTGDPGNSTEWSECACNNNPGDRRFIFSSGPFQLIPGAINDITFGCIWAPQPDGGCPVANFKTIKSIDDQAQALFDDNFKTVEGPNAPRLVCRPLDRSLVFYMVNDYGSNNFGENYGRTDGAYNDSLLYHQLAVKSKGSTNPADSLYKFEGYRVFQLANGQVNASQIFNETTGEVDTTIAAEVFECDIRNGVTQVVNYVQNIAISDTTEVPQIKVSGKDSGIVHSFVLNYDQFATASDKRFVNYHDYYFVAIAYAYNNFAPFNPSPQYSGNTQDMPYLGSSHAAGGNPITIVDGMPNPANGAMGTILNSTYGGGVIVTRLEGVGNGGNDVELSAASENSALLNDSVAVAVYESGKSPIGVKIVDPVLVPSYSWTLQIFGSDTSYGVANSGSWRLIAQTNKGETVDTIYGEENIGHINEQILEKYGISLKVNQVVPPGLDQPGGNGYITSDVTFQDSSKTWLFGVQDQADSTFGNWLRSGNNHAYNQSINKLINPCVFNDKTLDTNNAYENMFANFSPTKSTWGPYVLAAAWANLFHATGATVCGFEVAYSQTTQTLANFEKLPDVDLVFTPDRTQWTRCAVIEEEDDSMLTQGRAPKFTLRKHSGWDGQSNGNIPVYSDADSSLGKSWFPGYAIDEGTGLRLNVVFGEDSYLASDNGNDMLFNPSSTIFNPYDGSIVFGGRHVVYILGTKYDGDSAFVANIRANNLTAAYTPVQWIGIPTVSTTVPLASLSNGIIPTPTRLRFRVNRPYARYTAMTDTTASSLPFVIPGHGNDPYYTFSTATDAPTVLSDTSNRNSLLSRIYAVPNPYYGYSGYESNRFDTRVRIINLPAQATIYIYSLDGELVRVLSKSDPSTSYIDWDIRNTAGLPVASGMYLMDVKAVGIGETVIKWFGASRPIDVTTY